MSGVQRIVGFGRGGPDHELTRSIAGPNRNRWSLGRIGVPIAAFVVSLVAIVAVGIAAGTLYHLYAYGNGGRTSSFGAIGLLVALLYLTPFVFRDEMGVERFLAPPKLGRLAMVWTWAFFALAVIAFLTKTTATFSRGWLLLYYVSGGVTVVVIEFVMRAAVEAALRSGRLTRQRLMLIGTPQEIHRFNMAQAKAKLRCAAEVIGVVAIAPASTTPVAAERRRQLSSQLERAVVSARAQEIDGIILLSDWRDCEFLDECVTAFSQLPVSIHLDAGRLGERFSGIRIDRLGPISAFALTEAPLGPLQSFVKRAFDVIAAACGLILLSPVFLVVALLIKRDSPGPVFFRQLRLGYNQREFYIYKFRSMKVQAEDGTVPQASRNDPRITRIGRLLRRYNLDELPQLINVLRGEMSIVGPRPHAVAHDRIFEKRIDMYPRRLNMKPGITGWAQVHGHRGETDTDDKMAARVEHDLYYIDNWSLWLDMYIVALTVVSPKAYRNAH